MENVTLENGTPLASAAPGSKHQLREFVPLQLLYHGIIELQSILGWKDSTRTIKAVLGLELGLVLPAHSSAEESLDSKESPGDPSAFWAEIPQSQHGWFPPRHT